LYIGVIVRDLVGVSTKGVPQIKRNVFHSFGTKKMPEAYE